MFERFALWLLVIGIGAAAIGCSTASETKASYSTMTVEELNRALEGEKDFLLVNVHIPYAGEIPKTDVHIPYNQIEENLDQLPKDKNAKIVVYCRSGGMSRSAAQKLVQLGYTSVIDVPGGMRDWQAKGYGLKMDASRR